MKSEIQGAGASRVVQRGAHWLPWVVLGAGCLGTVLTCVLIDRGQQRMEQERFMRQVARMEAAIQERFVTVSNLLRSARAFTWASEEVTDMEWARYFRSIQTQFTDGIVGLGYVRKIARTDADAFEQRLRAAGSKDFEIDRRGTGDWLYVVTAIEPQERNTRVLGLDVAAGNTRREAAEAAARSNALVLSRRIRLDYESREVPGFLLFLPIYAVGENDVLRMPATDRLAAVQGWVYASIRVDELLADMPLHAAAQLELTVYERGADNLVTLLHGTHAGDREVPARYPEFKTVRSLGLLGRDWPISYGSTEEFEQLGGAWMIWVLGAGGLLTSVIGAVL
ncbi:MAG: CHASE domain-containing protein, partial [Opitutaceae bacterium]|nr:CHASE domain-containing protein [Opitutaceae bacterium]